MKIERMNKGSWGKVRAFFDLTTSEGFTIKGFKIIEGINGLFVSMPSQKSSDGEYYDSIYASKELREELNKMALDGYGAQHDQTLSDESIANAEEADPGIENTKEAVTEPARSNTRGEQTDDVKPFSDDDIPF